MAKTTAGILVLAAVLMAAAAAVSAQAPSPLPGGVPSCAARLAACATAMQGGAPAKECCSALEAAIKTELPCLCHLFSAVPNPQVALSIPMKCGLPVDANICSAAAPSHAPSSTPAATPSPAESPNGEKKSGAEKLKGTGLVGLILISIAMMFH